MENARQNRRQQVPIPTQRLNLALVRLLYDPLREFLIKSQLLILLLLKANG